MIAALQSGLGVRRVITQLPLVVAHEAWVVREFVSDPAFRHNKVIAPVVYAHRVLGLRRTKSSCYPTAASSSGTECTVEIQKTNT